MQEVFLTMMYERILIPSSDGYELPLDVYCPHVSVEIDPDIQRPAVVICPGGGYAWLSEREGEPIALAFTALGFNAFVVWYRIAPNRYPRPQQDVASAVAWVRAHAAETHTDPNRVAVMGFSAGGHCAGSLGVWWPKAELWAEMGLTPEQVKPNAMVLCYPVISGGPKAHRGSFECLTGSKDMSLHTQYSLDTSVTEQTPPTFLWHTWTDTCVPVENTLLMAAALRAHNVPAAVHIFPQGEHGASLASPITSGVKSPALNLPDCAAWPQMAAEFLEKVM